MCLPGRAQKHKRTHAHTHAHTHEHSYLFCSGELIRISYVTRCFNAAKTVQWTSTATGPITRMDSATCLANSGLVCEWSNSQLTLMVKIFHPKEKTQFSRWLKT